MTKQSNLCFKLVSKANLHKNTIGTFLQRKKTLIMEHFIIKMNEQSIIRAQKAWSECDAIFIGAGAGMGVDSGLPDFRGKSMDFGKHIHHLAKTWDRV